MGPAETHQPTTGLKEAAANASANTTLALQRLGVPVKDKLALVSKENPTKDVKALVALDVGFSRTHFRNEVGRQYGISSRTVTRKRLVVAERLQREMFDVCSRLHGKFPDDWRKTLFILLPKSGNLDDTNNWRPIAAGA